MIQANELRIGKTDVSRRFRLKRQEKEFNRYVENLAITTDGEKYVLHHILKDEINNRQPTV